MNNSVIEAAALIFEARICIEAVTLGIDRIIQQERSAMLAAELATLRKISNQAADALDALQKTIVGTTPAGNA